MYYSIKKLDKKSKLVSFNNQSGGYRYKIKENDNVIEVVVISPRMINALICHNFSKKYKKILELYLKSIESDEGDDTNFIIALDEIARLRSILIKKYHHLLKLDTEEKFLKRLKLLENEIRAKYIDFKLIKEQEYVNNNVVEEELNMRR